MNRPTGLVALVVACVLLLSAAGTAGEMKTEMKIDASNPNFFKTKFVIYNFKGKQVIFPESDGGIRFYLTGNPDATVQTGVYSLFALAGDCEVTFTYELFKVTTPKTGYGCGVGMAFDIGDGKARGDMQRVIRVGGESGFALSSGFGEKGKLTQPEERFEPNECKWGRMGLRRIKNELIFLKADSPNDALEEFARMSFTEETIRTVRLFADPGGSPTPLDIRIRQIEIRAEESTGGVATRDAAVSGWWWLLLLIPLSGGGVLFWLWRTRWRQVEEEEKPAPVRKKVRPKKV